MLERAHSSDQNRPQATAPPRPTEPAGNADESLVDLRCSVVVVRGDQILLLHRTRRAEPDSGDWVLPGGRPGPNESMVACARRETAEETGLDVVIQRCLFVLEVNPTAVEGRVVELVFRAEAPPGVEPVQQEKHRRPEFVALNHIQHLPLKPPVAGYLRSLSPDRQSGAAYLGNLWRPQDPAGEPGTNRW